MIKVNLLRNMGLDQVGGDAVSADTQRKALIKILVVGLFPGALMIYEKFNLSVLSAEVQEVEAKVQKVEQEKASFGDAAPIVEKYTKEKKKIDKDLDVIRGLAKNRLREVKALDALQSLLPSHSWISELKIVDNNVNLRGYSTAEEGVADLIRALDQSAFFSKVNPKSTIEEVLPSGPVKKFELEFRIGK
jgi:Tfp pilus assembly protein PilN